MDRMGRLLGWPRTRSAMLAAGIHAMYAYERLAGWRRMVTLRTPGRRDALGGPAAAPRRSPDGRPRATWPYSQPRRLNSRNSSTSRAAISTITAG